MKATSIAACLLFMCLAILSGCSDSNRRTEQVLNSQEERAEIYSAILNNEEYMREFMIKSHQNGGNRMMGEMMQNCSMMARMMKQDRKMMGMMMNCMMKMGEEDTAMCRVMCDKMMGNDHMMNMMQRGKMGKGEMR